MDNEPESSIDHPERPCSAIAGLIDELEDDGTIGEDRAAELRSAVYRSIDIPEE